jgi:hypothetical protein
LLVVRGGGSLSQRFDGSGWLPSHTRGVVGGVVPKSLLIQIFRRPRHHAIR